MAQPGTPQRFEGKPYLQCLESLENAFPALKSFLEKLANKDEHGRQVVTTHHQAKHGRGPGRCYCLKFNDSSVSIVKEGGFESPAALRKYLEDNPAEESRDVKKERRLFILEDMEPDYVDALGHHLGVDPLVFSEQMNTWNFTDSWSIPHRGLPSMAVPGQSFTLRYYELRTLFDPKSIDVLSLQMSFAINRRRYERWRDIDVPSAGKPDRRHAFVRRCASFWTSQDPTGKEDDTPKRTDDAAKNGEDQTKKYGKMLNRASGWDAVILVDPAFASTCEAPLKKPSNGSSAKSNVSQVPSGRSQTPDKAASPTTAPDGTVLDAAAIASLENCLILKEPTIYRNRASLWRAQDWGTSQALQSTPHESWPYHNGCSTLAPLMFSQVGIGAKEAHIQQFKTKRNLVSALDEMVFYWTKLASAELITQTNEKSSNASYYLLKHIAQHWVNQLELMNTTIAKGEWFSDDYQAKIDDNLSQRKWKADLIKINEIAKDINYMRRHLNHFWRAMYLNLERLGVQLGSEGVDENASLAIWGAQKDFLTIHTRMQPLRDRAEALNSVSNDLSNLRAAFRGVHDGEFGLRLSLFASVVFPLTLVAGIFSMGDDYRPGKPQFWKLWAIGPPFCVALALGLIYGKRPWKIFFDIWEYIVMWLKGHGLIGSKEEKEAYKRRKKDEKEKKEMVKMQKEQRSEAKKAAKAAGKKRDVEEGGVSNGGAQGGVQN